MTLNKKNCIFKNMKNTKFKTNKKKSEAKYRLIKNKKKRCASKVRFVCSSIAVSRLLNV